MMEEEECLEASGASVPAHDAQPKLWHYLDYTIDEQQVEFTGLDKGRPDRLMHN